MGSIQKGLDGGDELCGEFFAALGNESRQVVIFEMLPKAFDGVEVGTVRRKLDRFDVMPVKRLGVMPTGVVDYQPDRLALVGNFFGHGIEEGLKDFCIIVRHDQAHQPIEGCDPRLTHF